MGWGRSSCIEPRATLYKRWARREKEGIQEYKKPAVPRNNKISSFVEGTARDWVSFFLSKVIASWVGVIIVNAK